MPTMTEIYQKNSFEYDELITHEDYLGNLHKTLHAIFNFNEKSVIELGTGTGRLTQLYIQKVKKAYCYDNSNHMLNKARINLKEYQEKILFSVCDNNEINKIKEKADFVIEGWSFGHAVNDIDCNIFSVTDNLVENCKSLLNKNGKIIIFETLGTNTKTPTAPTKALKTFYSYLEDKHKFKRVVIDTDYRFKTADEAVRVMGFFFGEKMAESLSKLNNNIVKEFTGMWYKEF